MGFAVLRMKGKGPLSRAPRLSSFPFHPSTLPPFNPPMRLLAAALIALVSVPALAQPMPAPPPPGVISVSGEGVVSVSPDRARIRVGVVTRAATAPETLRQHEQDVLRVLTRVRQLGVADRDIRIESLSLGENYGENGRDGYVAQRTVTVTLDTLRLVPDLVAAVVSEGANQLQGIDYVVRDTREAEAQALDRAVADARAKAERIASASGVALGRVVGVQEAGAPQVGPPRPMFARAEASDAVAPTPGAYSAGSNDVVARVTVQFEIAGR